MYRINVLYCSGWKLHSAPIGAWQCARVIGRLALLLQLHHFNARWCLALHNALCTLTPCIALKYGALYLLPTVQHVSTLCIQHGALRCTFWRVSIIVGKDLIAANTLEQRNSSNGSIIISISMGINIDQHRHQQLYHEIHEWMLIEKWEYLYRRRSRWSVSSQKYWNIFTWTIREGYKYKGISISIRE